MPIKEDDLANLKPKEKAYRVLDGGGLSIEVMPDGSKYWRLRYQLTDKEKITLGKYPKYSLSEARRWRFQCTKLISLGISPKALKLGQITLTELDPKEKELADTFLNNWCWSTIEKFKEKVQETKKVEVKIEVEEEKGEERENTSLEMFAKKLDAEIAEQAKTKTNEIEPEQENLTTTTQPSIIKRLFGFVSNRKK
jgi:hypothetical protein